MKTEFLLARYDHQWDTVVVNTPDQCGGNPLLLVDWFHRGLLLTDPYRDVVFVGVYCTYSAEKEE